jgi:hypothetical protein
MQFNHQNIVNRHTTATEVIDEDLPSDPLSHLVISLDGYNATDETTLAEILAFINNVQVNRKGVTILDMQSEDLYAMNAYLLRRLPILTGRLATDNYTRLLSLIVPMGRRLYDPEECYPRTQSGDLQLLLNTTVPTSSLDNSTITVDAITLPDASPKQYLKSYRKAISAPGSTGEHEIELARGNRLVCCQFRLTTIPTTSSHTYGIDEFALMLSNREAMLTAADVQSLIGQRILRVGNPDTTIAAQGLSPLNKIVWLDFDPNSDGRFLVDTSGESSVKIKCDYGVDEAQNLTVMELVNAGEA